MKCVIGGQSLQTWYRMIHKLVEIGDEEVFFDFAERIVTLSTTNSSLSTFSTFILFRNFFESYSITSEQPEKIAIPSKVILKPFRTQRMAKHHVSSELDYNTNEDHITITSKGKSHASSTYRLGASENNDEILFDCDPYTYKNFLKVEAKVLSGCLSNFSHMKGLSELCLKINGERVMLRNSVTDVTRKDGSVVTEYNLTSHDFLEFEVHDGDMEFSFGFREFKLFTTFAEQLKLPVHIHFQSAQDPIIIVVKMETFEGRLCLATRQGDPFNNLAPTPSSTTSSVSNGRISNVTTQNSAASSATSRNTPQLEVNRNRGNISRTAATTSSRVINNPEPPPAKRIRRTEAAPPVAELPQSNVPFQNDDGENGIEIVYQNVDQTEEPAPVPAETIEQLVDKLEKRKKLSPAYRAIQRIISRPRISENEYLKSLPGHDVVLCPESDDEES